MLSPAGALSAGSKEAPPPTRRCLLKANVQELPRHTDPESLGCRRTSVPSTSSSDIFCPISSQVQGPQNADRPDLSSALARPGPGGSRVHLRCRAPPGTGWLCPVSPPPLPQVLWRPSVPRTEQVPLLSRGAAPQMLAAFPAWNARLPPAANPSQLAAQMQCAHQLMRGSRSRLQPLPGLRAASTL